MAALQDTNDHFQASLQLQRHLLRGAADANGEVTPDQLIVIGEIARDFGLYTDHRGQRIDLFSARVENC